MMMHGVAARRTARHFGLDYNYDQREHVEKVPATKELRYSITFRTLRRAFARP